MLNKNGDVSLSAAYKISVYATADGYKASDKAEATLYWINANLDNGTNINQVRTRGVVASAHGGIVSLSGLDDGEVVKFFAAIKKIVYIVKIKHFHDSCKCRKLRVISSYSVSTSDDDFVFNLYYTCIKTCFLLLIMLKSC